MFYCSDGFCTVELNENIVMFYYVRLSLVLMIISFYVSMFWLLIRVCELQMDF